MSISTAKSPVSVNKDPKIVDELNLVLADSCYLRRVYV